MKEAFWAVAGWRSAFALGFPLLGQLHMDAIGPGWLGAIGFRISPWRGLLICRQQDLHHA
ncbi:hypothetical protein ASE31_05105 [Acidovorax sp. Root217]|nr:hypothetical protein ASE31_05105 [Acidovorax sp. Root217]